MNAVTVVAVDAGTCAHPACDVTPGDRAHYRPPTCGACDAELPTVETYTDVDDVMHAIVTMRGTCAPGEGSTARIAARRAIVATMRAAGHQVGPFALPAVDAAGPARYHTTQTYGPTVTYYFQEA